MPTFHIPLHRSLRSTRSSPPSHRRTRPAAGLVRWTLPRRSPRLWGSEATPWSSPCSCEASPWWSGCCCGTESWKTSGRLHHQRRPEIMVLVKRTIHTQNYIQPVQLQHWPFSSNKHLEGLKSKYWPLILSRNVNVKYGFCPNLLALNQLFGTMSLFFSVQQKTPCSSVYIIGTTDFHFLFLIGATNFPFLVEAADSMKLPLCQGQLTDREARYIVNQQSQSFV